MSNCVLCSKELKFSNTPTFGSGKLNDGGVVCIDCYKKINNANAKMAYKLKNYTLYQVQEALQEKLNEENSKNSKLDEIKEQIKNLNLSNASQFLGRKEIKELPQILAENENINHIVQGTYNNGNGILVSTNRRLIFIDKGFLYGLKVEDFPHDKISSIQYETGLLLAKIKIHTSGNIALIDNVEKSSARQFSEFVRDYISQPKQQEQIVVQTSSEPSILDQLEKLGKLKEMGILTDEEFSDQKKKLLEKM
jgi:hypothetical protein